VNVSKPTALLSTLGSLGLACLLFSSPAFGEAILRTTACSTLSQVNYNGRDYAIRSYAVRHNLEWKNPNEEFDLQLHEQLSDTFPPFATIVRDLVRAAKGEDGRELSGSESAQVLGLYGTKPGPVVFPTRDYSYAWTSSDEGVRTDEVDGKVVGRHRVIKRKLSDDVELIQQILVEAPKGGGATTRSEETSCFRFKQPRWRWSELVPAPLETAAAAFDPLIYAADNAWNQLKECRAAKGSCESLARFPEDVQVDEQGWLVLDQGSGYLNHVGDKTNGENLITPAEAMQKTLEQQQLLAQGAAAETRAEPNATKPEAAQPAMSEARSSASHTVEAQEAREPVAEAAAPTTPKIHSGGRSEAKTARRAHRERSARVQRAERRTPPSTRVVRVVHAPEEDFDAPMMAPRPWLPLGPPRYEVRVRRDVSPFYFLFDD
jgi:hypothetical protein